MAWVPLVPVSKGLPTSKPYMGFASKGGAQKAAFLSRAVAKALGWSDGPRHVRILIDIQASALRIEDNDEGPWTINVRKDGRAAVHGLTANLVQLRLPCTEKVPAEVVDGAVEVRWPAGASPASILLPAPGHGLEEVIEDYLGESNGLPSDPEPETDQAESSDFVSEYGQPGRQVPPPECDAYGPWPDKVKFISDWSAADWFASDPWLRHLLLVVSRRQLTQAELAKSNGLKLITFAMRLATVEQYGLIVRDGSPYSASTLVRITAAGGALLAGSSAQPAKERLRLACRKFWNGQEYAMGSEFEIEGWSGTGLARIVIDGIDRYVPRSDFVLVGDGQ